MSGIPEIDFLLAAGLVVVVPLALSMFRWIDPQAERLRSLGAKAAPYAGVAASIPLAAGGARDFGALLSAPWLAMSVIVGISAAAELIRTKPSGVEPYLPLAACAHLVAGAVWLLFHQASLRPMNAPAELVEVTAVHFNFAGVATPVLAYHASRWLRALPGRWDRLAAYAGFAVALSMVMIAAGVGGSALMELEGSILMGLSLVAIAAGTTLIAFRLPPLARLLLLISSVAVWISMVLAVQYAFGQYTVSGDVSVRDMAQAHGVLTLIFAVCGLLGWRTAAKRSTLREPTPAHPADDGDQRAPAEPADQS
ncbi:MAG TPA: YndJ family transporter [Actinomycetota bacterium]|nr:YndJ family transporter [Actinomycetota bacterium]